ncbi:MAG: glycine zipper 2TM domain-containing protein [Pseudomonadota bacterium]|nr:glycine zipper 2TM domain-containing protein [Pseudomonadota bacterium]
MPRLKSSRRTNAVIAATVTFGALMAMPATSETRIETVLGTVTNSDPIRTSYIRKTPSDERVCETQDVPVYGQASAGNNNENSDLGAMIIGGVIGSAIGNKTSDQEGAGAAGAVVGALLGREHAKKKNQGGQQIIGYRQQEVCNVRTVMIEETIQEITGYRTRIEVDNRIITVETNNSLSPNERVELTRQTTYSLR